MAKPEVFRLQFVGADEDVPRLIQAGGRGCGGLMGLVIVPAHKAAALILQHKDGSVVWRGSASDCPRKPAEKLDNASALDALRALKRIETPARPATLRGSWAGLLECRDGAPVLTLERRIASYGVLRVVGRDGAWHPQVERQGRWFAGPAVLNGDTARNLVAAISEGLALMGRAVSEACTARDTRRRGAYDPAYASAHPPRPAKATRAEATARVERELERPTRAQKPKATRTTPVKAAPVKAAPVKAAPVKAAPVKATPPKPALARTTPAASRELSTAEKDQIMMGAFATKLAEAAAQLARQQAPHKAAA